MVDEADVDATMTTVVVVVSETMTDTGTMTETTVTAIVTGTTGGEGTMTGGTELSYVDLLRLRLLSSSVCVYCLCFIEICSSSSYVN